VFTHTGFNYRAEVSLIWGYRHAEDSNRYSRRQSNCRSGDDGDTGKAFAIFYTSVIGSGGLSPVVYGAIADHSNRTIGVLAAAATAALVIPFMLALRRPLQSASG
jgi:hypothetical protein